MGFQKMHSFQDKSSHTPQPMTQFLVRPFEAPVKLRPLGQSTHQEMENEAFERDKFEAHKLEIKEKYDTITPEEQKRLGGAESGDGRFLGAQKGTDKRFGHNFANIPVNPPEEQDAPQLQPMWRDGTPGVPQGRKRSLFNFSQQSSALPLQTKLTIGQPEDQYEQEADRVASQVVEQIHAPAIAQSNQGQSVQRQEEKPEGFQTKPILQRREVSVGGEASTDLESAINNEKGSGQPIEASLQESMGQAMGADFSQVRVHTDAQSDQLNQSIQAKAFTTGQDVFFRQGAYEPGSREGQELIAHELTHVVQQKGHLSFAPPIQRLIESYQPGKLRTNYKVMAGLNQQQMDNIQNLHDDPSKTYTINEARQLVGAAPLDTSTDTSYVPPFPFRYNPNGGTTMKMVTSGMGGLVQYPSEGIPHTEDTNNQMSFAVGHGYGDLPTGSKRNITQTKVMDNISPNEAANKLGFKCPTPLSWEWLHLVAFSIGQTHVGDLSQTSQDLIQRTNQPQQIRENLVLGTAAANTEMLSYETKIKRLLTKNQAWKLNLVAIASKTDFTVNTISIPVATRISYHFYFETGSNTYTPPVIVEFDTQSHDKPATKSFETVCKELDDTLKNHVTLKEPLKGISTDAMDTM